MKKIELLALLFLMSITTHAQIPQTINFQGILTELGSGNAVTDGNYDFIFKIYDDPTVGTALWTETHTGVPVSSGLYNVILGDNGSPLDVLNFDQQYYLEVTVEGETLSSRIMLSSTPYSLSASRVVGTSNIFPPDDFVGIGTISPTAPLYITGNDADIVLDEINDSGWPTFSFNRARGAVGSLSSIQDGDVLSAIYNNGFHSSVSNYKTFSQLFFDYNETKGFPGSGLYYKSVDDAGNLQPRLTIDAEGNMGLGELNPLVKIHASGNASDVNLDAINDGALFSAVNFRRAKGTVDALHEISDGNFLGGVYFSGYFGSDYSILSGLDAKYFDIGGTGHGTQFRFWSRDDADAMQTRLVIDEYGQLGIGEANPACMLDVGGSSGGHISHKFGIGTPYEPSDGIVMAQLNFTGENSSGADISGAVISAISEEDWSAGSGNGTKLTFVTGDIGGGYTNVLTLSGDNNVGIGEINPLYKLQIEDNSGTHDQLFEINQSGTTSAAIRIGSEGGHWTFGENNGDFIFSTGTISSGQKMAIKSDGKVGIGTTSPGYEMVVANTDNANNTILEINNPLNTGGAFIQFQNDNTGFGPWMMGSHPSTQSTYPNAFFIGGPGFTRFLIQEDGDIGIGTFTPSTTVEIKHGTGGPTSGEGFSISSGTEKWSLVTNSTGGDLLLYQNNTYKGAFAASDGSYTPTSDYRLKKNIGDIPAVLNKIKQIQVRNYHFKTQQDDEIKEIGVIAQEVMPLFPSLVKYNDIDDLYSVNYSGLGPLAIKAIQEQQSIIDSLSQKINELSERLEKQSQYNQRLSTQLEEQSRRVDFLMHRINKSSYTDQADLGYDKSSNK